MFDHYVMFKMKPEQKAAQPELVRRLEQLQKDVPTIRTSRVLVNIRQEVKSYDLLFHVQFDNEAGLQAYMVHPKHVPVIGYVEGVCASVAVVDVNA